ncbi:MAG: proline dehydrogenase family protein [Solirubrobacteraceae bacterium]
MLARRALFSLATSEAFEWAVGRVPGARERAWRSARRYVAGEAPDDALQVARALGARGLLASIDLFGERVTDPQVVRSVADAYVALAGRLPEGACLSIDLSHVAFDAGVLRRIAAVARVQVGAEAAAVTDRVLDAVLAVGGERVDATLQANLPRSAADAARLAAARVPVRLVKGAYVEPGALPWGPETDAAYARLALELRDAGAEVRLATHDEALLRRVLPELPGADCELLLGVRPELAAQLRASGRRVRVYVPYGPNWFRYLMRRRAETQGP